MFLPPRLVCNANLADDVAITPSLVTYKRVLGCGYIANSCC